MLIYSLNVNYFIKVNRFFFKYKLQFPLKKNRKFSSGYWWLTVEEYWTGTGFFAFDKNISGFIDHQSKGAAASLRKNSSGV